MTPIYDQLLTERLLEANKHLSASEYDFWVDLDTVSRPMIRWPERERQPHQFGPVPPYAQWEADRD